MVLTTIGDNKVKRNEQRCFESFRRENGREMDETINNLSVLEVG